MGVGKAAAYTARQSVRNSGAAITSSQIMTGSNSRGALGVSAVTNPLGLSGAVVDKALARVGGTGNVTPTETRALKSRRRHIKEATLRLSVERANTHVNTVYRTMSNDPKRYFSTDPRMAQANHNRVKSSYSNDANTPMRAMPMSYNRYGNPHLIGKSQIAIEEGEATFGMSNKVKGDLFLRTGPTTQPKMKLDLDAPESGNHYLPNGVNPDLGKWAHFNTDRTQKLYDNISGMNKGRNMFYLHAGKMSKRQTKLLEWYKDLLERPVPTITTPISRNSRLVSLSRSSRLSKAPLYGNLSTMAMTFPGAEAPQYNTFSQVRGMARLERPEFS